jgi:hypothetical protein
MTLAQDRLRFNVLRCICRDDDRQECDHARELCKLTPTQRAFVVLHRDYLVTSWREVFHGAMLRAATEKGKAVSITVRELEQLVALGLITMSHDHCWRATEKAKVIT